MKVKWTTKKNRFPSMQQAASRLNGREVQAGVFGEQAWLAGIHEYGCKIKVTDKMRAYLHGQGLHLKGSTEYITIPERAFLRNGHDGSKEEVLGDAEAVLREVLAGDISPELLLSQVGEWMASHIRDYAVGLDSPPNHPFTVDRKGSSNPLVDTGDMVNAVSYEVK